MTMVEWLLTYGITAGLAVLVWFLVKVTPD